MEIADRELKEAALIGLQFELDRIAAMIGRVSKEIGAPVRRSEPAQGKRKQSPRRTVRKTSQQERSLSAEGRARIAEAARRKWAEYRARKAQQE